MLKRNKDKHKKAVAGIEDIYEKIGQKDDEYENPTSPVDSDLKEVKQEDRLDKMYQQLYSDENLAKITELNKTEINKISIIQTYALRFGFNELIALVENFLRNRVSLGRKGREEYVKIGQAEELRDIRIMRNSVLTQRQIDKRR